MDTLTVAIAETVQEGARHDALRSIALRLGQEGFPAPSKIVAGYSHYTFTAASCEQVQGVVWLGWRNPNITTIIIGEIL